MTDSIQESHLVLLHLSPIKNALRGQEWTRCKDKVLATAHRVIGETLSAADAYTIHGDETCMIAFAKTDVAQAESTAAEISDRIVRSQFGEIGLSKFPLQPRVLAIRDLLHSVDSLNANGVLNGILNSPQAAELTDASTELLDEQRKGAAKAGRRRKLLELFEPERAAEVTYEYRPIWCADNQRVDRFKYVPCLQKSSLERLVGYGVLGLNRTEADIIDLDIASAENALIDLKQAADAGHDIKLSLPVHFETIGGNRGRSEFMKILPVLPSSFRERLSFWIDGIPEGIPEGRLQEVIGVLKPFSENRWVMFEARPENTKLLRNTLAKVRSVGMDTVCLRLPRDASHTDLKDLCAIVPQATCLGLKVAAVGLTGGSEVFELTSSGCSLLGGPLFGGPFDALPKPYSMPIGNFEQPGKPTRLPKFLRG